MIVALALTIVCQGSGCPVATGAGLVGVLAVYDQQAAAGVTCQAVRVTDRRGTTPAGCVALGGVTMPGQMRGLLFNLCVVAGEQGQCAGALLPGEAIVADFQEIAL